MYECRIALASNPAHLPGSGLRRGPRKIPKITWRASEGSIHTVGHILVSSSHEFGEGCGHVGFQLGTLLNGAGARLVVSDIDEAKAQLCVEQLGAAAVSPEDIYGVDADIFSPCALGGVINDVTLRILQVDIVAGAANNQLDEDRYGDELYNAEFFSRLTTSSMAAALSTLARRFPDGVRRKLARRSSQQRIDWLSGG